MDNKRKIVLRALTGSWNYNLNTVDSDKDYKLFVIPTFEDLYKGEMFHQSTITQTEDNDVHDIRKLPTLMWKANNSYLEALYSFESTFSNDDVELVEILSLRDQIVTMNLPYLYNSCIGNYKNKIGSLFKGTEGTQNLVEKYGFDTKQALHAYRNLDFLLRFHVTNFKDFYFAHKYEDGNDRERVLEIKHGRFTSDQIISLTSTMLERIEKHVKPDYMNRKPNEELKAHIDHLIMELVRNNLKL